MTYFVPRSIWFAAALLVVTLASGQNETNSPTVLFHFLEPQPKHYRITKPIDDPFTVKAASRGDWIKARPEHGSARSIEMGPQIVLQLKSAGDLGRLINGRSLKLVRTIPDRNVFILQAADAWTAAKHAEELAARPEVLASYPMMRRPKQRHGGYARRPDDPLFFQPNHPNAEWQPYLENRDTNGAPLGVDLNVRAAWGISRGEGITVAIGDDGVELNHPDLLSAGDSAPHLNLYTGETNGLPIGLLSNHGTAVAGLLAARADNRVGMSGVAPLANIASWILFNERDDLGLSEDVLMQMFQYQSNVVSIQNHSWGKEGREQLQLSLLEDIGISNAVTFGRAGLGVVMVRAAGNDRLEIHNANDDGYTADARVIAVAAARLDGRVARYGTPGACILVAAPSGDVDEELSPCSPDSPNLLTTDRQGPRGYNANTYTNDLANYAFGDTGFSGTSASTPLIAGVAALVLGANTNLSYRDVQQILVHSARHFDLTDPALQTNGAGFRVSHNLGYGVPDAGAAVRLAQLWAKRPALSRVTLLATNSLVIPDQGLRLVMTGPEVPETLRSIIALPGLGAFPDNPTATVPLVNVGQTIGGILTNLTGKAALIQRGGNFFCEKVSFAATAGAAFAAIYNNRDVTDRIIMGATDFSPIPVVCISQQDGEALRDFLATHPETKAQLQHEAITYSFTVKETLLCEHVALRVNAEHSRRGDLRITLVSPQGTRSLLQSVSNDDSPGPLNWTYLSTLHFYESSAGLWKVIVSDVDSKGAGKIKDLSLTISGVPITDSDADGLDDQWETRYFGSLASGPQDDPDGDGYNNAREQITGTNPKAADAQFQLNLSLWDQRLARLSWPSTTNSLYQLNVGNDAARLLTLVTNIPGRFPETEVFVPFTNLVHQFFRVQALPNSPVTR